MLLGRIIPMLDMKLTKTRAVKLKQMQDAAFALESLSKASLLQKGCLMHRCSSEKPNSV